MATKEKKASAFASLIMQSAEAANVQILDAQNAFGTFIDHTHGCSVGSLAVDFVLKGGLPNGRFHQIYGPSMAGKTTFVTRTMGMAQQMKRPIIHIDSEYAADIHYMRVLGLDMKDTSNYAYAQPYTGDDAFRMIKRTLEAWGEHMDGPGPLIVIDSLKALTPGDFMENDEKNPIGLQARMFSTWMPPIKALVGKTNAILLGVNQVRQSPMAMFSNPETIPGGEALMFFSDTIIRASRVGKIEENDFGNSVTMRLMFKKLKHATPGSSIDLQLIQGIGYDPTIDIWKFLELTEMGVNTSGYYSINPYDGLPPLPEGIEVGKNYRWNDLRPYMIPAAGYHYSTAPLYHWCFHILSTGKIFDAIRTYNETQATEQLTADISASTLAYDFSALWKMPTPMQVTENALLGDEGSGVKGKKAGKNKAGTTRYCLTEYETTELPNFVGHEINCTYYDDDYPAKIVGFDPNFKKVEIAWLEGGEIEFVPLNTCFYDQATATA